MSSSTTQTTENRRQIIDTDSFLRFIPISLLFFPLTFFTAVLIQLYESSLICYDPPTLLCLINAIVTSSPLKTLIVILAFTIFVILPTITGITFITYNTNHKQLNFSGSMKLILLCLLLTFSPIATIKALGLPSDLIKLFSIFINTTVFYALVYTFVFTIVTWGSSPALAVLELKYGLQPLRQSTQFRSQSFSIVFFSGFGICITLANSAFLPIIGTSATNWFSIFNVCLICFYSPLMIFFYVVANTVLYVRSKEVSGEYVKVVVDDGEDKVLHQQLQPKEEEKEEIFGGFNRILCAFLVLWFVIIFLHLMW